jgi:GT2 family glycosyltransferase
MSRNATADESVHTEPLAIISDHNNLPDVVIVTHNSVPYIEDCLESIRGCAAQVVVVDNGSQDGTVQLIDTKYPSVKIVKNKMNLGYASAINAGYLLTRSQHVVISNADIVFSPGSISRLCDYLDQHPSTGAAGPQLVFPDGSWQESYGRVLSLGEVFTRLIGLQSLYNWSRRLLWPMRIDRHPKAVGYIVGAAMAIRREAFDICNGWDEAFHFYVEDVDFCERVRRAGFGVRFVPDAKVVHVGGGSSSRIDDSGRFTKIWSDSVMMFIRNKYSEPLAALYMRMQALHFRNLALACSLLRIVARGKSRSYWEARSRWFAQGASIWYRQLNAADEDNA